MASPHNDEQNWPFPTKRRLIAWIDKGLSFSLSGWRGKILSGVFLLITLGIIVTIIAGNWDLLQNYRWQFRPIWLAFTALFFIVDLLLAGLAWHLLTIRLARYRNFRRSMKITWYANLARRMPGPVWYIASRAVLYEKEGVSKRTTSLLSALEIAFLLVSGVITSLLTLPFWLLPQSLVTQLQRSWLLLPILGLSVIFVHPRVIEKVWRYASKEAPAQRLRWRDTIQWLALYIVIWIVGACVLFSIINFFQPLAVENIISVIGMWALSGSLSLAGAITITSIGLREVSLTLLLTQFVPMPVALLIVIAVRIVWLVGEISSAIVSLKL